MSPSVMLYDGTALVPLDREAGETARERLRPVSTVTLERVAAVGMTERSFVNPPHVMRAVLAELASRRPRRPEYARAKETGDAVRLARRWIVLGQPPFTNLPQEAT